MEAQDRPKLGSERSALISRIEQEIAKLPSGAATKEWIDGLWGLPESEWLEEVEICRNRTLMMRHREATVSAITQKNKLLYILEHPEECGEQVSRAFEPAVKSATATVERAKIQAAILEQRYWYSVHARKIGCIDRASAATFRRRFLRSFARGEDRRTWKSWIASIPFEDLGQALLVRLLHSDISYFRQQLEKTLEESGALPSQEVGERVTLLENEVGRLESRYHELSDPLFERYGAVDVGER